jgi:hypothetical protein
MRAQRDSRAQECCGTVPISTGARKEARMKRVHAVGTACSRKIRIDGHYPKLEEN